MTNEQAIEILSNQLMLTLEPYLDEDGVFIGGTAVTEEDMEVMEACEVAIQALERQQWTPITKKWPDKKGRYLVTYREWSNGEYLPKYDNTYVRILRYHESIFRFPVSIDEEAEKDTNREVIAWMPLPESYKEEE